MKRRIFFTAILLLCCAYVTCMEQDIQPFTLEQMKTFNTHEWGNIIKKEVQDHRQKDSFRALFEDPVCQRLLLSPKEVQAAFCDDFFRWFQSDTLIESCDCPYGDYWPAVRRMIALSALIGFTTNQQDNRFAYLPAMIHESRKIHALEITLFHDDVKLAQLLLERGAKPNAGEYRPAFMNARSVPMAELLLKHGADYTHEKVQEWTLLHTACSVWCKSDLMAFYLSKGVLQDRSDDRYHGVMFTLACNTKFHALDRVKPKFEALLKARAAAQEQDQEIKPATLQRLRVDLAENRHHQDSVAFAIEALTRKEQIKEAQETKKVE